ncbi:hypothetical protein MHZ95_20180 [Sporosarcina sp. ACRSM]|uniref:hypothetical protein n=1 Tax=Sporosarcina sp. ACRSM TaxID=2918216 RepID=UPI001EF4D7BF|nr:hypothetical protein [Sporosarcina sp. ACRSM]MCG7337563.1 hypothetical protein [Sporosarcina sp. ACRSM]
MKKITDERLILRNLQNTRIAYVVQTIGILCILGYNFFQGGLEKMRENPLWLVLILTTVVYFYLSMSVSVEHERKIKNPMRSFLAGLIVLIIAVVAVGYLVSITPNFSSLNGLFLGAVLFICSFIPLYYVYRLRVKHAKELEEE